MPVTIKDIATKAGVSVVTVSRALNDKPDISKTTKEHILKIAQELGYTPNSLAKSLVTRKTNTIGILVPDNLDPFYPEVVQGIADKCRERDYSIILCHTDGEADKELEYLRLIRSKRADGMIIYPVQNDNRYIEELKNSPIPFVFVGRHTDALDCDYVMNDNVHGAYLAVNHLLQKGHTNITYICAKPFASSGKERITGCKKAISEKGLPPNYLNVVTCEPKIESCYKAVKELILQNEKSTAIFIWDDKLAIGALKAILEAGMRIPQDIAIVGYNDTEIARHLFPPLTTVRHASYQIGEIAARILLDRLDSDDILETKQIVLKPELVVRKTT
ncbi:MAG: LacI family DNA-binding transcriptional regulator [bacterium]|nr:MAG: LacI family DNA-binding transcriptional regulator [bacterium]